jgi:hypothetical protein
MDFFTTPFSRKTKKSCISTCLSRLASVLVTHYYAIQWFYQSFTAAPKPTPRDARFC